MRLVLLSGGVGGARLARGLAKVPGVELTVVVNVGDDDRIYGVHLSPDLDTMIYTLAGIEGEAGWGIRDDTGAAMQQLNQLGVDTSLHIGDRDLAINLFRTQALAAGDRLSEITEALAKACGVLGVQVLPATDQNLQTKLLTETGEWLDFQDYFVIRRHQDRVQEIRFEGSEDALPAPGVTEAISTADAVVIAPSNPVLSIWPILAVNKILAALLSTTPVVTVSPLQGGKTFKGPAAEVLSALSFPPGNRGVLQAYEHVLGVGGVRGLVVAPPDQADRALSRSGLSVAVTDTGLDTPDRSVRFAEWLTNWLKEGLPAG